MPQPQHRSTSNGDEQPPRQGSEIEKLEASLILTDDDETLSENLDILERLLRFNPAYKALFLQGTARQKGKVVVESLLHLASVEDGEKPTTDIGQPALPVVGSNLTWDPVELDGITPAKRTPAATAPKSIDDYKDVYVVSKRTIQDFDDEVLEYILGFVPLSTTRDEWRELANGSARALVVYFEERRSKVEYSISRSRLDGLRSYVKDRTASPSSTRTRTRSTSRRTRTSCGPSQPTSDRARWTAPRTSS